MIPLHYKHAVYQVIQVPFTTVCLGKAAMCRCPSQLRLLCMHQPAITTVLAPLILLVVVVLQSLPGHALHAIQYQASHVLTSVVCCCGCIPFCYHCSCHYQVLKWSASPTPVMHMWSPWTKAHARSVTWLAAHASTPYTGDCLRLVRLTALASAL